jgi:hypothetical protein
MNDLYTQEFVKQAQQAGLAQEKIATLLQRASQIANRSNIKTASKKLDIVDSLIKDAGLQKTASSVSYVQGILNEALTSGANIPQAIGFTKQALYATGQKIVFMDKVAAIQANPQLSQYAEGFLSSAKTAGLSQDEAVNLLVDLVDNEKRAGGDDMFKGAPAGAGGPPPGAGAPMDDPSAGGPPGMGPGDPGAGGPPPGAGGPPPGGGEAEEAQILQMLQSLPPEEQQEVIQQLLAAISGGQGGPGGPGAGGPPPGAGPQ